MFFVNLNATSLAGQLSPRVYTTVPLALAFYYVFGQLNGRSDDFLAFDRRQKAPQVFGFLGTLTIAGMIRFELDTDWVVVAWAALVLVLLALARRSKRRMFFHQGLPLAFAVLVRTVFYNFYPRSYFPAPFWHCRLACVGMTAAVLFVTLPFAFALRPVPAEEPPAERGLLARLLAGLDQHPEQVFFFIPFTLLTALLALEMRKGIVTLSWGLEAVAVFLFALWVGQRSYRLSGLGLLLLCVGRIVLVDVWGLQPRDRYVTFIALGGALLLVSFLYTHYRETLRQYL